MAVECALCKTSNPDGAKFCSECGNALDRTIQLSRAFVRDQVREIVAQQFKDQKVVEIETTQAIADRLLGWAKLLGFAAGIPVALLLLTLGVFGIEKYNDFYKLIDKGKSEVITAERAAADLKSRTDSIDSEYQKLSAKISDTKTSLEAQVKTLSVKVDDIEEKIRFTPASKISDEDRRRLNSDLAKFQGYMKGLGDRSDAGELDVGVTDEKIPGGFPATYDVDRRKLTIGRKYVDDSLILYRTYSLQILSSSGPDSNLSGYSDIYSGLATYFSYSFVDNPKPPTPTSWDLAKKRAFIDGTERWGSAFWQLRTELGKDATDKLLLEAWYKLHTEDVRADRGASFVRKLVDLDKPHEAKIRAVFEQRGLSL